MTIGRDGMLRTLVPFWAGEGFPADVRTTLRTIEDAAVDDDVAPVVVARRLSPGSRALLTGLRTCWADESGAIDLATGPFVIRTPGNPSTRSAPPLRLTPAAGALAELLLTRARDGEQRVPAIGDLADTLGMSRGAASRALTFFDAQGWTSSRGPQRGPTARRELSERGALLDAWGRWYAGRQDETIHAHAVIQDPDQWLRDVVVPNWRAGTWAVTGLVALDQRAPYATAANPIDLYLDALAFDSDIDVRLRDLGLARAHGGVRVRILRADRFTPLPGRDAGSEVGYPLVGDVRLYGDLLRRGGVRGEDYATHVREQRIGF